jgi:hypothetical protein
LISFLLSFLTLYYAFSQRTFAYYFYPLLYICRDTAYIVRAARVFLRVFIIFYSIYIQVTWTAIDTLSLLCFIRRVFLSVFMFQNYYCSLLFLRVWQCCPVTGGAEAALLLTKDKLPQGRHRCPFRGAKLALNL